MVGRDHAHARQRRGGDLEPDGFAVGSSHSNLFIDDRHLLAKCTHAGVFRRGQRSTIEVQEMGLRVSCVA